MLKQSRLDDVGKLTLRLMVGILILLHGVHELFCTPTPWVPSGACLALRSAFVAGLWCLSWRSSGRVDGYPRDLLTSRRLPHCGQHAVRHRVGSSGADFHANKYGGLGVGVAGIFSFLRPCANIPG